MIADIRFTISVCGTTISFNGFFCRGKCTQWVDGCEMHEQAFSGRLFPFQSNVYELAPFPQALEKLLS